MTNVINVNFVAPKPQHELNGKLGLTVSDIAKSLNARPSEVRRKLAKRGDIEHIKACGFGIVSVGTPITSGKGRKQEITDYVLDVNAAKFFMARYENEMGNQYLSYLVKLESEAQAVGNTYGLIDPTDLTTLFRDPKRIVEMANLWAEAEEKAKIEKERADKAEATIKLSPVQIVRDNAIPAHEVYRSYPVITRHTKSFIGENSALRKYGPNGSLTIFLREKGVERIRVDGKDNSYSVFSRADLDELENKLGGQNA